jgi:hypothetical protein
LLELAADPISGKHKEFNLYMSISSKTLDSIQAAGAAAFAAHAELQTTVSEYSERMKAAVMGNAFDIANDNLFAEWKTLARLTQVVGQIEAELLKVYSAATSFSTSKVSGVPSMPALSLPQLSQQSMEVVSSINATDVRVKKSSAKGSKKPATVKPKKDRPLRGNSAKLLSHLLQKLNSDAFVEVNRSALAGEIGIPIGSIGASVSKLLQTGNIVLGPKGQLKLV